MKIFAFSLTLTLGLSAAPVLSQTLLTGDHSIDGRLCAGRTCTGTETFPSAADLVVKGATPFLLFDDTSNNSFADRDWSLRPTGSAGAEVFQIYDEIADHPPFVIEAGAPENALYINTNNGWIGLGTALPGEELHIVSATSPNIRLEDIGNPQSWDVGGNFSNFFVEDVTSGGFPFRIAAGAPDGALRVADDGDLGVGTISPQGKLHTRGAGVQLAYFESSDGDAVQVRFRTDSENRRFLAVDNADNVKTQMQFRDDAILFLGQTVAQEWLRVDATGITTAGPSCGSPCDAVFDPEVFTVPPIADRTAQMWSQRHLPAIGPTAPDQPMNMTEKLGGVIHELEVAHIYIGELHNRLEVQEARLAQLEAMLGLQ